MGIRLAAVLIAAAAGGACSEGRDLWRYEKILYEETPAVRSRSEAQKQFDEISARAELTLEDCHRLALHRSETLALNGEELVRLQTQYEEALGSILPWFSFKGSWLKQEDPRIPSTGVQRSLTLSERTEFKFYARQPIFSGLREYYSLRQGSALYEAKEHDLRHARLLLFADVADAFYAVLQVGRDLATIQDSLRLAEERLQELTQRNLLGISRRSEVLAQDAEVASTRARMERLKGALAVTGEALRFLTGLAAARALKDTLPEPGDLDPVENYVRRAFEQRSDLKSLRDQIAAAEHGIGIARAGYFPTVALEGNYYTHREGVSENINWDVLLSFEVPIFEGAVTQANLREARSFVRSATLQEQRRRRQIDLEINRSYADAKAFQSELVSLEKAVASAQENYEIVQAEYRQNIVTNIEVLAAFNQLQGTRLERDRARFQAKLARVRLDVQSGNLPGGIR